MAFTQKRTCKGCLFSHVSSCEYGVHIEVIPHAANKPLEPFLILWKNIPLLAKPAFHQTNSASG